jgi:hypothetical protein
MKRFALLRIRVVITAFALSIALVSLCAGNSAFAGTPHSSPKSCGYPGGPPCRVPAPIISPWQYIAQNPQVAGNPRFNSVSDLEAGWTAIILQMDCSVSYDAPTDTGQNSYSYGVLASDILAVTDHIVYYNGSGQLVARSHRPSRMPVLRWWALTAHCHRPQLPV